jgi:(S)-2-hydroxyglutarate dehydrogenase
MSTQPYDVAIIGGGIVGMATAMALLDQSSLSLVVLEAEDHLAAHQTGHNSGVIHSGLYYKPGSLKAKNCVEGREAMYQFCEEHSIAHKRCGKVVVAISPRELPALDNLEKRGQANGLVGMRRLNPEEIKQIEPHATGIAGLFVPQTGIVDYTQVTNTYGDIVAKRGGTILTRTPLKGFRQQGGEMILSTPQGEIRTRNLINCAGLQCDRIAKMCGVEPGVQIVPFRGEYYDLVPEKTNLVNTLIYPVPDPRFPFLGVHFSSSVHGVAHVGPNAVIAFKREGYRLLDISIADTFKYGTYIGFWRMVWKYWRTGMGEFYRSLNMRAFLRTMQSLVPEVTLADVHKNGSGVRAQAMDAKGTLVDDFHMVEAPGMIHVLNAPSPAATASISIGKTIKELAIKNFGLH